MKNKLNNIEGDIFFDLFTNRSTLFQPPVFHAPCLGVP